MKKIKIILNKTAIIVLAISFIISSVVPGRVWAEAPTFSGGDGSPEDPYQITTCQQLQGLDYRDPGDQSFPYLSYNYVLMNNIDCSGIANFDPLGINEQYPYTATFDGNNKIISNLTISSNIQSSGIALFDHVGPTGIIKDLNMIDANIDFTGGSSADVAVLVGYLSGGEIQNVSVAGTVDSPLSNNWEVGGLVAYADSSAVIADSSTDLEITAGNYTGGLVGYFTSATIVNSHSGGSIKGGHTTGGLVGQHRGDALITRSFSSAEIISTGSCVGGLVGDSSSVVSNSYATGAVITSEMAGGLVGCVTGGSVSNSYSTGTVSGGNKIGGFADDVHASALITNSFSTGFVNSEGERVGGFVSSQAPLGFTNIHWLKTPGEGPQNCYYNSDDITECTSHTDPSYFKGNSTSEPMASWDFSDTDGDEAIWKVVSNDYPILAWQPDVEVPDEPDTTAPTFSNLPGLNAPINITEGQLITTNPFIIKVKPTDSGSGVQLVEFYVDDNLLCTDSTADNDGVYECAWDTSKYHSQVKVIAYDTSQNQSQIIRDAIVDPKLYLSVLPKTGK